MEVYRRETEEVIRRFLHRKISFPECLAALDSALEGAFPTLTDTDAVGALMLANIEIVFKEMERRRQAEKH